MSNELTKASSEVERTALEKSQHLASMIQTFLPIIDMIEPMFDMEHAKQCLSDMEKAAANYDQTSIVLPGGWNKTDSDKLRLTARNWKSIIDLVWTRREMKKNAMRKAGEKAFHEDYMKQLGLE